MFSEGKINTTPFYGPIHQIKAQPQIIYKRNEPDEVHAITFHLNGKKYFFSNEEGHKVYSNNTLSPPRPMTKKEFKDICTIMILNSDYYGENTEIILDEIDKLNFALGHANSTFEIATPCIGINKIGTLIMNIGSSRYLYNQDNDSVLHIDHSKLINGSMLKSPEKDEIISKIRSSKTMSKKIYNKLNKQ